MEDAEAGLKGNLGFFMPFYAFWGFLVPLYVFYNLFFVVFRCYSIPFEAVCWCYELLRRID